MGDEEFRWFLVPWALLAAFVAVGMLMAQPSRRRFDPFTPVAFAAWSHVVPAYVLGVCVLIVGWKTPVMYLVPVSDEALTATMAYALLGFVALTLGFLLPAGARVGHALARALPAPDWSPAAVLGPGLVLLALGAYGSAAALERGLLGYQVAAGVGPFDALLTISALSTTTLALALLAFVMFSDAAPGVRGVAAVAIVLRTLAEMLLSGKRGTLLGYAFVLGAAYVVSGRRVRPRQALAFGGVVVAAVLVGMAYGSTFRELKGDEAVTGLDAYTDTVAQAARATAERGVAGNLAYIVRPFAERLEIVSNAAVVVENHERLQPFEAAYGLNDNITTSLAAAFIPRALWPDKPPASDPRAFGELYFNYPNAFAVTAAADLLRNYGVAGIPIGMALLGVLLRVVYAALVEQQPVILWRRAAYVVLLTTINYEAFFGSIVPMLIRTAAVVAVCLAATGVWLRLVQRGVRSAGTRPTAR